MTTDQDKARFSQIPAELRELHQWVCWRKEDRDGKPTKVPCQTNGQLAKVNDPATWTTFETAVAASGRFDGIGFVFTAQDGFFGVDWDEVIGPSPIRNVIAMREALGLESYCEYSQSGTGIHAICRGKLPGTRRKKGGFEIYEQGRFFVMTGDRLPASPSTVNEATEAIAVLARRYFANDRPNAAKTPTASPPASVNGHVTDDVIIAKITAKTDYAALWRGDWAGYPSQSEADLALCSRIAFFVGRDENRIRSIFARSGLNRDKWQRDDYSCDTITKALAGKTEFYRWTESGRPPLDLSSSIVPLGQLIEQHPELRPPLIDGLLRRGEVMNIIAPPKIGKSWLAHNLALAVAHGRLWLERFSTMPGRVLLIDNELHPATLSFRLRKVAEAMGLTPDYIDVLTLRGRQMDYAALKHTIEQIGAGQYEMILFDAHYRLLSGRSENDNAEMMEVYNLLDRFAEVTGAALVLIHHASKGDQSGKDVTDVGAGAGSQSRATDAHLILRRHKENGFIVLEAVTRSFSPLEPVVLAWNPPLWEPRPDADPKQLETAETKKRKRNDDEGRQFVLAALQRGDRTARSFHGTGVSPERAKRILDTLVEEGLVDVVRTQVRGNETEIYSLKDTK